MQVVALPEKINNLNNILQEVYFLRSRLRISNSIFCMSVPSSETHGEIVGKRVGRYRHQIFNIVDVRFP